MARTPLTTKQAILKYSCSVCKDGGDCEYNCVESSTCSYKCPECCERVWFLGNKEEPINCQCPYCKKDITLC
jgi:hypothetical protein